MMMRREHEEYRGLCTCGCRRQATISDGMGQYATQQCRDDFYGPVAWQMPSDPRPASEIAEEISNRIQQGKVVVNG